MDYSLLLVFFKKPNKLENSDGKDQNEISNKTYTLTIRPGQDNNNDYEF